METKHVKIKYPLFSIEFCKSYLITMRPYLMFVSGVTGIAGISFGTSTFSAGYLLLFSAAFLSYGFGQALTDCFQIDTDSISSPYRPLTKGLVSKSQIFVVSCFGMIYCVLVYSLFNPVNLILGILAGTGLATYTPFKRKWWAGPFYNSWIVGILFLMSVLSVSTGTPKLIYSLGAVFFGYSNFVLSGYFKDISADRATGYNTLPVVFGRKVSSIISDVFAFLTLVFSSAAVLLIFRNNYSSYSFISIIFLIIGTAVLVIAQVQLHLVHSDDEAYHPISYVVHSYILILSSVAAANKPEWGLFLTAYYFFYLFVLKIRPSKNQI
jgi:geranylgeranylglycerol-phosphate geranylgeranyltransferase